MPEGFAPLSAHAAGLRPKYAHFLEDLDGAPRYDIAVEIFPERRELIGHARIAVRNPGPEAWTYVVFQIPARLPRLKSTMEFEEIRVEGQSVAVDAASSGSILTVPLPEPLPPGAWTHMELDWTLQYADWGDDIQVYALLGTSQNMLTLPHFHPRLAVYAPDAPGTDPAGWWVQAIPQYADITFADVSLMRVTATLPSEYVVLATGHLLESTPVAADRTRHRWITGPVRGFLLQASPDYVVSTRTVQGVSLRMHHRPFEATAAANALDAADRALRIFQRTLGPYPYPTLSLASSPLDIYGMEYSNALQIGSRQLRDFADSLDFLVAHEVSHQWWHLMVHNDPVLFPWIDEGLAETAYVIFLEAGGGGRAFMTDYWQSLIEGFESSLSESDAWWTANPAPSYLHYYRANYTRSALFLDAIRSLVGDEAFHAALRELAETNRFGIIGPQEFLAPFRQLDPDGMADLEREWWDQALTPATP